MVNTERSAENESCDIESTFILITSNLSDAEIESIRERVREAGLSLTSESHVQLNRDKIQKIWPGVIEEDTQERTYEVLSDRDLLLINIAGVSAISQIVHLKKVIRNEMLEVDDGFNRIMHCPDTHKDLLKEIEIFFSD